MRFFLRLAVRGKAFDDVVAGSAASLVMGAVMASEKKTCPWKFICTVCMINFTGVSLMRSLKLVLGLVTALVTLSPLYAEERSKTFASHLCRYTLPNEEWAWFDLPFDLPEAIASARGPDNLILALTIVPAPMVTQVDQHFVAGFEKAAYGGRTKKRGGRILTFKGVPCYQSEGLIDDDVTTAARTVVAHGFSYTLQVLGDAAPVEQRPEFEAIMNGFELTSPPAVSATTGGDHSLPYRMG